MLLLRNNNNNSGAGHNRTLFSRCDYLPLWRANFSGGRTFELRQDMRCGIGAVRPLSRARRRIL